MLTTASPPKKAGLEHLGLQADPQEEPTTTCQHAFSFSLDLLAAAMIDVCVCVSKKQRHFKTPKWIKWIQFQLPLTLDIQANTVPFGPPKPTHQTPFTSRSVFAWMSGGSFPYGFFLPCKASNVKIDSKLECFIYTETELSESRKTMVTPPKSPTAC